MTRVITFRFPRERLFDWAESSLEAVTAGDSSVQLEARDALTGQPVVLRLEATEQDDVEHVEFREGTSFEDSAA